jgi:hypothetical protein
MRYYWLCSRGGTPGGKFGGALPEVTKGVALVLLLGALTVVPPKQRLLTVLMLPGRLTPEDGTFEAELAAIEKVAEDWRERVLSTMACACGVLQERAVCPEERLFW